MPRRKPSLRIALACAATFTATFAATALTAAPAFAEDRVTTGVLFYGMGSFANIHGLSLGVSGDGLEADPLKGKALRLEGGGHLGGGGFQVNIWGPHARGGIGMSIYGIEGTTLRTRRLTDGFTTKASEAWGVGIDAFVGHEFLRGSFRPYIDLVTTFNVAGVQIDLSHPDFGFLGRNNYHAWTFGIGPRVGFTIPMGDTAFFDVSGMYSFTGMERFRIVGGFGVKTN